MSTWRIAFNVEVEDGRKPKWALAAATDACDAIAFDVDSESVELQCVDPPLKVVPDKSYGGSE